MSLCCIHLGRLLRAQPGALQRVWIRRSLSQGKSTVDQGEIERFNSLAQVWWKDSGEYAPLHAMNELRVPLIRDALAANIDSATPLRGLRILDVGCGGGILSEPLARLGADVVGVDASAESIDVAEQHRVLHCSDAALTGGGHLTYRCTSVEDLVVAEGESFDAVVASEILEHVNEADHFLKTCCQLAKPKGSLFITTLNKTAVAYALGVIAAEYLFRIVPRGTHDWQKFVSPQQLEAMLLTNNFRTLLIHGMCYNPLINRWHWTRNHSINYCTHAIKVIS